MKTTKSYKPEAIDLEILRKPGRPGGRTHRFGPALEAAAAMRVGQMIRVSIAPGDSRGAAMASISQGMTTRGLKRLPDRVYKLRSHAKDENVVIILCLSRTKSK